jgi:hypothetical protein
MISTQLIAGFGRMSWEGSMACLTGSVFYSFIFRLVFVHEAGGEGPCISFCVPHIFMGLSDQQILLTGYWRAHDMLKLLTSLLTKLRSGEIHTTILDPDFCISLAKDRFLYAKVVDSPMRIDNFSMN